MKTTRRISVLFFSILMVFTISQLYAGFFSGNKLVERMREFEKTDTNVKDANMADATDYMGYVTGVYDATEYSYNSPEGITRGQICWIVAKYLKEHPERWSESAATLVIDALKEAFPFKKSGLQ